MSLMEHLLVLMGLAICAKIGLWAWMLVDLVRHKAERRPR